MIKHLTILLVSLLLSANMVAQNDGEIFTDFSLDLKLDYRQFFNDGLYDGQKNSYLSFAFQPEFEAEWKNGQYNFKFTSFSRIDQHDSRRTHFDIREMYWQMVKGNGELSIGSKKVFWGKTESAHLVDIINQTDFVESFDGEEKLGQPMVHYSYLTDVGIFDLFYLPYFRTRQFAGKAGRLRTPIILDGSEFPYESSAEEFRPGFAGRWSHYIGKFDIGVSHFYGTGREPIITDFTTFQPIYAVINQTGIDIQVTTGPMLWKWESINRTSDFQDMFALAAGFEYSFYNIANAGLDIGILTEYLYDDRDEFSLNGLQNDIFAGSRLAFNDVQDTEILFGVIFDLERSTKLYSIEANRRIGNSLSVDVEARIFSDVDEKEFLYFMRDDSFMQFSLTKYF